MHATHEIVNYTSKLIICALFVIPHLVPPIIPNGRHSMESLTPRFELINQAIGWAVVAFNFLVGDQFR